MEPRIAQVYTFEEYLNNTKNMPESELELIAKRALENNEITLLTPKTNFENKLGLTLSQILFRKENTALENIKLISKKNWPNVVISEYHIAEMYCNKLYGLKCPINSLGGENFIQYCSSVTISEMTGTSTITHVFKSYIQRMTHAAGIDTFEDSTVDKMEHCSWIIRTIGKARINWKGSLTSISVISKDTQITHQ